MLQWGSRRTDHPPLLPLPHLFTVQETAETTKQVNITLKAKVAELKRLLAVRGPLLFKAVCFGFGAVFVCVARVAP